MVRQFRLPFAVCVNKSDLNPKLERRSPPRRLAGAAFVATVEYDPAVTLAQLAGTNVVNYRGRAAADIAKLWEAVSGALSPSLEREVLDA